LIESDHRDHRALELDLHDPQVLVRVAPGVACTGFGLADGLLITALQREICLLDRREGIQLPLGKRLVRHDASDFDKDHIADDHAPADRNCQLTSL
jgi:hypothetical protein